MNPLPILRDAWFFFSHNLAAIARLCLPLLLAEAIAQALLAAQLGEGANPAYGILLGVLFYPLYAAQLILFLDARSNGRAATGNELFAAALRLWPGFALLAGLSTLANPASGCRCWCCRASGSWSSWPSPNCFWCCADSRR